MQIPLKRYFFYLKLREEKLIRVLILNLNPSYDHWILLDEQPELNHVLRGKAVVHQVDGKGLNIGRIFSLFEYEDYLCINMLGGPVGKIIEAKCSELGIKTSNFWIQDESRINTAIVHEYEERRDVQMVNESGPIVTREEVEGFKRFFTETVRKDDLVVISGSAAEGFLPSDLSDLASITRDIGGELAVDISSDWLKDIVSRKISILKINDDEIRIAFGIDPENIAVLEDFRRSYNIEMLIITYGEKGAVALNNTAQWKVIPPKVNGNFAVGSGDSFFAGFLFQKVKGSSIREALICGTACGAANAGKFGAALFNLEDYDRCKKLVEIRELTRWTAT